MVSEEAAMSPLNKSPWSSHMNNNINNDDNNNASDTANDNFSPNVFIGALVREEGLVYSLAASRDLLYTGSDSKNIRIWKQHKEYSGFKSNSGYSSSDQLARTPDRSCPPILSRPKWNGSLSYAAPRPGSPRPLFSARSPRIIIAREKIFTGHQDGKIRVWKVSSKNANHKRIGTLPTLKNYMKCSMKPSNYVEVRGKSKVLWIKHFDSVSCLSLSEDQTLLYSASWDKTFKVWRVSDFKCLE